MAEQNSKLTIFKLADEKQLVTYIETMQVKQGVSCDVYEFSEDRQKDLGIVTVAEGCKTPLQKVLKGDKTIEGFISGSGKLTVTKDGKKTVYEFRDGNSKEVQINVGEIMQWHADGGSDLVFFEICYPPYEDGRFENLSE